MSWVEEKRILTNLAKLFEPKVVALHTTDHWFTRILAWIIYLITFGTVSPEQWRANTAISAAGHIFLPEAWNTNMVLEKIPHEARHTTQQADAGLGGPLVGMIPWLLLYISPIPIGLALGRCFLEIDAKKTEWKLMRNDEILESAYRFAKNLSSSKYLYAAPEFITRAWCEHVAKGVIDDPTK
jgi:hypothetical protein